MHGKELLQAPAEQNKLAIENSIALGANAIERGAPSLGSSSIYTCPECQGAMVAIQEGTFIRFRCHTGHGFTQGALAQDTLIEVEKTLWAALAKLEENQTLQGQLAHGAAERGLALLAARHRERAQVIAALGERIRALATDPALATPPIEYPLEDVRNSNKR
jgi:two-component system chemotaxis response regulator CheB